MNKMKKAIVIIVFSLLTTGCAITTPDPVAIHQRHDDILTCKDLEIEYRENTIEAERKIKKNKRADINGVIFAILVVPVWDAGNADGWEGNALLRRNGHIRHMARKLGCDMSEYPDQCEIYE